MPSIFEKMPRRCNFCASATVYRILNGILGLELVVLLSEGFAALLNGCKILVHIKSIVSGDLDNASADVGAMVGYTLEVGEKVGKHEAVLDGTLALLKS